MGAWITSARLLGDVFAALRFGVLVFKPPPNCALTPSFSIMAVRLSKMRGIEHSLKNCVCVNLKNVSAKN